MSGGLSPDVGLVPRGGMDNPTSDMNPSEMGHPSAVQKVCEQLAGQGDDVQAVANT
jgi:hypothetical protein